MEESIKKVFRDNCGLQIVESLIMIFLGVILICNPDTAVEVIMNILGAIFVIVGAYKIINYLLTKKKYDFYNYDALFGIMACILGIVTICYSREVLQALQIVLGVWIIYSALVRMSVSIKLKRLDIKVWTYSLILSLVMFCCGLFLLLNPAVVVTTLGIVMIIYSIFDIIEEVILIENVKEIL